VNAGAYVLNFCPVTQHSKAPCETRRRINHQTIIRAHFSSIPLTESGRAFSYINCNEKCAACRHSHQLSHAGFPLKMQTSHNIFYGSAVIVLNEIGWQSEVFENIFAKRLHEKTALIFEYLRLQHHHSVTQVL